MKKTRLPSHRRNRNPHEIWLDKHWGVRVKERDGYRCRKCGRQQDAGKQFWVEAAHIQNRWKRSTRWLLDNGVCLCMECHRNFHRYPHSFQTWVVQQIGMTEWERLETLSNETFLPSEENYLRLRKLLTENPVSAISSA